MFRRRCNLPRGVACLFAAGFFVLAGGCGGGSGSPAGAPDSEGVGPGTAGPEAVARALADPERAEEGVWALLELLGVGVYAPDGQQRLAGSERGEDDFWLYDFEIPWLAAMSQGEPAPFEAYADVVRENGYPGTAEDLRAAYARVYGAHPDHPLVRVLEALGVRFDTPPELTPLERWILALDTFVPPNGRSASRRAARGSCGGTIQGGLLTSSWGLAGTDLGLLLAGYQAYVAMHGLLLAEATSVRLEASAETIHKGLDGPGDAATYTLTVTAQYVPQAVVDVGCGVLVDVDYKTIHGGLEAAEVEWTVSPELQAHVSMEWMDGVTGPDGKAVLKLRAGPEEVHDEGMLHSEWGLVSASVNVRNAFVAAGVVNPDLLAFVPPRLPAVPVALGVEWHEACDGFSLGYEWIYEMSAPEAGFEQRLEIRGAIPLTVDLSDPSLPVVGEAELTASGGGHMEDDCAWTVKGTDRVQVTGNLVPGEGGEPPRVRLTVQHVPDIRTEATGVCGAGPGVNIPYPDTVDLPLQDGARAQSAAGGGDGSVQAGYTLELPCPIEP